MLDLRALCLLLPGQCGFCRTRENREGRIHTLVYGLLSATSLHPMEKEKKPFYPLYPGDLALTWGMGSCNFTCPSVPEWGDLQTPSGSGPRRVTFHPRTFLALAQRSGAQGVSLSFNE